MAHLITGYAGYEHIQSKDQGALIALMLGAGQFVANTGNKISASIIDNNTVRILDGDLVMYGRHIRIEPNEYEDVTIKTGTAGKHRVDLICMTYEKNANDGTEKAYLQVIQGEEVTGTAEAPTYTDGNILNGEVFNQMPLYKVTINGVVLESIELLFETCESYTELVEAIKDGTTTVGNADKLDNYDSSYFAPKTDLANYLPLSGGTVTGRIGVRSANTKNSMSVFGYNDSVFMRNETDGNNYIDIQLQTTEPYVYKNINGSGKSYKILHEGSKPTGTYTGNGSATARNIDVGGIGYDCVIIGSGNSFFVSSQGALHWNYNSTTVDSIPSSQLKFDNGKITIASDNALFNKASTTYYWHLI